MTSVRCIGVQVWLQRLNINLNFGRRISRLKGEDQTLTKLIFQLPFVLVSLREMNISTEAHPNTDLEFSPLTSTCVNVCPLCRVNDL